MATFYKFLKDIQTTNMPAVTISERDQDIKMNYNKNRTRLDRIAGEVYEDETMWRIILWANPQYFYEFDIPDNAVIRVPLPKEEVLEEVRSQIQNA